jgi:hypothetical protein
MSNSKENQEFREPLPSLPVRWFILFRLSPYSLFDLGFLYHILIRRSPIFWDNIMKSEKQRILRKKERENFKGTT